MLLYALAAGGGSAAYGPFLTLLLPVHALKIWQDGAIALLAYAAFAGAVSASLANIFFGWLSDWIGHRRPMIVVGAIFSSILLISMRSVESIPGLIVMIIGWQFAINMMLAPLGAWAGDCVPDSQKGMLGGLLSAAPALGALVGVIVTLPGLAGPDMRLVLVALLVIAMIFPVIIFGRPISMPHLMEPKAALTDNVQKDTAARQLVWRMWLARILIQISEATLFAYLLLWLRSVDDGITDNDTAHIFTMVLLVSIPFAMLTGRWSDRRGKPILPLVITSGAGACGLAIMGAAGSASLGIAGYVLFGTMAGVFLSLHASQTLRVLPRPQTRGRDLGIFNLTNTLPSMIMPSLTLLLVPLFGFSTLFLLLAGLSGLACLLLLTIRKA